jgi:hypothetical protein
MLNLSKRHADETDSVKRKRRFTGIFFPFNFYNKTKSFFSGANPAPEPESANWRSNPFQTKFTELRNKIKIKLSNMAPDSYRDAVSK